MKPECPKNGPYGVMLQENKTYLWCACGRSKNQPYCDNESHKGTDFLPVPIRMDELSYINLCGCKKTKNPPYCDQSHLKDE